MNEKIIVRGIHLTLTPTLSTMMEEKAGRLLRHNSHITRVRLDLEFDKSKDVSHRFIAKGQIEIDGPSLVASAESEDGYKSVDQLIDKLDRLLGDRHARRVHTRNDDRNQAPDILHGKV